MEKRYLELSPSMTDAVADATLPRSPFQGACVDSVVFMPVSTLRAEPFPCVVHSVGDGLKMIGVNASRIETEMIDCQPLGDGAYSQNVGDTMGTKCDRETAIPPGAKVACPPPAAIKVGFIHLGLKDGLRDKIVGHLETLLSGVVRTAANTARPLLSYQDSFLAGHPSFRSHPLGKEQR